MTINKRKKNSRQRAGTTHGWGSMKKHRGKGHQGGAGMAGSGKRADQKKPTIWKKKYFGKHGFKSKTPKVKIAAVNVGYLEKHMNKYISRKLIREERGAYSIELEKLGFNKLLGSGSVKKKLKIKARFVSKSALEKVKNAGGDVEQLALTKPKTAGKKTEEVKTQ
jgi:large subunit ribosomal protein L15